MNPIQLDKVYDVAIIGSGMGGSAFAYALQDTGAHIIILERGNYLKQEDANWDANEVVLNKRYEAGEMWFDAHNQLFDPRAFYNVGGSSKVYGASMFRYREEDFAEKQYPEGNTVAWPITYKELMPFYDVAERALGVRGNCGEDPTEPLRDSYPFPAVQDEPVIADIRKRLKALGLAPFFFTRVCTSGGRGALSKGQCV